MKNYRLPEAPEAKGHDQKVMVNDISGGGDSKR